MNRFLLTTTSVLVLASAAALAGSIALPEGTTLTVGPGGMTAIVPDPPPPVISTLDIGIAPASIERGQSAVLRWAGENVGPCFATGGWAGSRDPSGIETVMPAISESYALTCQKPDGSVLLRKTDVSVTEPPLPDSNIPKLGMGCTTAYFIDKDCDGFGVGKKESGKYLLGALPDLNPDGTNFTDSPGDMPDADDMDPEVNTTASWQAKWGNGNAGLVNFLRERKGHTNTDRIFYMALDGNDATGKVNDPAHPFRTVAPIIKIFQDRQGGALVIRGGDYGTQMLFELPGPIDLSGSPGHTLYVMAYPGEQVITQTMGAINKATAIGNVTYDGFTLRSPKLNRGDIVSFTEANHITLVNNEFIGGHQTFFANRSEDILIAQNVFHNMGYHAIYFGLCCNTTVGEKLGDIDFAAADRMYYANQNDPSVPNGVMVSYRGNILNNVLYNNGDGGYEPIHIRSTIDGVTVDGNIISYSGGTGIGLQYGVYHARLTNNVIFDGGRAAITPSLGSGGTLRWNTIQNNTVYMGDDTTDILGSRPAGGVLAAFAGLDTETHWIKDFDYRNNLIVTHNNGPSGKIPFTFQKKSYPDSYTIVNNLMWSNATSITPSAADRVLSITPDAGGTIPGGNYSFAKLQTLSPKFSGNIYTDPKLANASAEYLRPDQFDFALKAGSPAIDAGIITEAPSIDVRGVLRDGKPDIGAYEFRNNVNRNPLATLVPSSRVLQKGQSATLTWLSLDATSCAGAGFDTGGKSNGSIVITPGSEATYGLICHGPNGDTAAQNVLVQVLPASETPIITSLIPRDTSVLSGRSTSLTWKADGTLPYRCVVVLNTIGSSGNAIDKIGPSTGMTWATPTVTTTYGMLCYNLKGATSEIKTVTVTVQ